MIKGLYLSKESRNMLNLDDSSKKGLSNLIHYLAREEKGKVSIAKLKEAFKLSARAPPLLQEQITEEKQVMRKMTSMWKTGAVPGAVRHVLHWMQENHHQIKTLFKGYESNIPVKSFELILEEKGYQKQDASFMSDIEDCLKTSDGKFLSLTKLE